MVLETSITNGTGKSLQTTKKHLQQLIIFLYRNAERLTKSAKIDIKKKKLHIKSVDPSVNGVYRCAASNEAGVRKSEKDFALAVPGLFIFHKSCTQ